jgi:hypothetical protein
MPTERSASPAQALLSSPTISRASFARAKFTKSLRLPSGWRSRNMAGHFASGTMATPRVTLRGFSALDALFSSNLPEGTFERLCEAGGASDGLSAAELALQWGLRCAATRQAEPQKRAERRRGLNSVPQCEHTKGLMRGISRSVIRVIRNSLLPRAPANAAAFSLHPGSMR